ncbi:MAG: hypothetical protein HY673_02840 [Chloroflexi bacterium]|nr:hypothetical protein [Chloroflexota bacterium]
MKKTLQIINRLKARGLFEDYALGGGMGAVYYIEPVLTYDLDIFIILKGSDRGIVLLTPIFEYLTSQGYKWEGEHIVVEGLPVQFIVADDLEEEAIRNGRDVLYQGVRTKVMGPEYLVAIFLRTGRQKDIIKVQMLLSQAEIDRGKLKDILEKYGLTGKFRKVVHAK